VIAELEQLFERHGKLQVLRSDNGREFIAASLLDWLAERGVRRPSSRKAARSRPAEHEPDTVGLAPLRRLATVACREAEQQRARARLIRAETARWSKDVHRMRRALHRRDH